MAIDIWTDSMFFDLTFEQERDENHKTNGEKDLPNVTIPERKYNWNLFEGTQEKNVKQIALFCKYLKKSLGFDYGFNPPRDG